MVRLLPRQLGQAGLQLVGDDGEGFVLGRLPAGRHPGHRLGMDERLRTVEGIEGRGEPVGTARPRPSPGHPTRPARPGVRAAWSARRPRPRRRHRARPRCRRGPARRWPGRWRRRPARRAGGEGSGARRTSRRAASGAACASRPRPCWPAPRAARRRRHPDRGESEQVPVLAAVDHKGVARAHAEPRSAPPTGSSTATSQGRPTPAATGGMGEMVGDVTSRSPHAHVTLGSMRTSTLPHSFEPRSRPRASSNRSSGMRWVMSDDRSRRPAGRWRHRTGSGTPSTRGW